MNGKYSLKNKHPPRFSSFVKTLKTWTLQVVQSLPQLPVQLCPHYPFPITCAPCLPVLHYSCYLYPTTYTLVLVPRLPVLPVSHYLCPCNPITYFPYYQYPITCTPTTCLPIARATCAPTTRFPIALLPVPTLPVSHCLCYLCPHYLCAGGDRRRHGQRSHETRQPQKQNYFHKTR